MVDLNSEHARALNMSGLQSSKYIWKCLNNSWISLNVRRYVNGTISAWMAFVLHFSIVIPCLKEPKTVFLKRRNFSFSIVPGSIWFAFCFRLNIFTQKISNLLSLGTEDWGPWILIFPINISMMPFLMIYLSIFAVIVVFQLFRASNDSIRD